VQHVEGRTEKWQDFLQSVKGSQTRKEKKRKSGKAFSATCKSIRSEVVKQTKSPKSDDFVQNLVSNELVASTVKLMIVRTPRLMRRGQSRSSVVIFHLFIPFSWGGR
jgi:hypothetical protein